MARTMHPPVLPRSRTVGAVVLALAALSVILPARAQAVASAPVTAPAGAAFLQACRVPGIAHEVLCGTLTRPLDPQRADGTRIGIGVVVVPARARHKRPDPVVMLAGGPGQSAIKLAPKVMPGFARLNNLRDIVFVDQRGTGRSAPLACPEPAPEPLARQMDPRRQDEQLQACLAHLRTLPHGDLRFYGTTLAMQDLDAVRAALGVPRWNLVGASYGTRAGLEYLRLFPDRVRRLVIDGVAPPDMVLPTSFSVDNQSAFDAMLAACRAEPACATRHPDLPRQWARLLASVPREVRVAHPVTGRPETVRIEREHLLGAVRAPLYVPALAAGLPQAIDLAEREGRFEALLGLGGGLIGAMDLSVGMHFSVVCTEDAPRLDQPAPVGADFGRVFEDLYRRTCATWPRGQVDPAFYRVGPSPAPVLVLSGGLDPVTPPRHGERVARALGDQARHLVMPHAGHGVMVMGCAPDLVHRFLSEDDAARALALDAACLERVPRPGVFHLPDPMAPAPLPAPAASR
jgi:pimeloyl-ACP methyl ester carboxylesterase